jgi:hypothetical protein
MRMAKTPSLKASNLSLCILADLINNYTGAIIVILLHSQDKRKSNECRIDPKIPNLKEWVLATAIHCFFKQNITDCLKKVRLSRCNYFAWSGGMGGGTTFLTGLVLLR